ncbi:MAG TPA: hypothetical protein VKL22_01550 [Actinomycetota bacterium]|nr:hypothetical protein [Actinomycetota bacterium]
MHRVAECATRCTEIRLRRLRLGASHLRPRLEAPVAEQGGGFPGSGSLDGGLRGRCVRDRRILRHGVGAEWPVADEGGGFAGSRSLNRRLRGRRLGRRRLGASHLRPRREAPVAEEGSGLAGSRSLKRSLRHDFVRRTSGRHGLGAERALADEGSGFVRGRRDDGLGRRLRRLRAFILLPPRVPPGLLVEKECALAFQSRGWRWR